MPQTHERLPAKPTKAGQSAQSRRPKSARACETKAIPLAKQSIIANTCRLNRATNVLAVQPRGYGGLGLIRLLPPDQKLAHWVMRRLPLRRVLRQFVGCFLWTFFLLDWLVVRGKQPTDCRDRASGFLPPAERNSDRRGKTIVERQSPVRHLAATSGPWIRRPIT